MNFGLGAAERLVCGIVTGRATLVAGVSGSEFALNPVAALL